LLSLFYVGLVCFYWVEGGVRVLLRVVSAARWCCLVGYRGWSGGLLVVDGIEKWWVLWKDGSGWIGCVTGVCTSTDGRLFFSSALTWEKDDVGSVSAC
jgi:hypothetical protein